MKKLLLKALLNEYLSQLQAGFDSAEEKLEKTNVQVRKWNFGIFFRPSLPTEDSPANEWHWENEYTFNPALYDLDVALSKFSKFLESL